MTADLSIIVEVKAGAKVCEHYVALAINKNIVWLDVSMNIAQLVNTVNRQHHFCEVEPCHLFWQAIFKLRQQRQ